MKPMLRDAHGPLLRAVARTMQAGEDRQLPMMTIESVACHDWASATFVGQRHVIALCLTGADAADAATRVAAQIGEIDIPLAGHVVADIAVVRIETTVAGVSVVVEALTLVD